ncbi:MAG: Cell division ATP-binding protein FtsE [Firmicutes bacterium]|nr:Cell division ATP-binding protein FtsE [Bacillota bacterium]MBT9152246.1 Cell division ATP-binding protein FtsE [Bacillota bacterium]MBT9157307.1 Cell division ATP-binding protein FtsE [Bacillota bacterium]
MIEFVEITKQYPGSKIPALSNVSLQIQRGEFVFLVGSSGAGKSTMLRLLFREYLPSSGSIFFLGRDSAKMKPGELLKYRRRIGMVFQDFRLLKQKTVFENVAFALEVVGRSSQEIRLAVPVALAEVGLLDRAKAFPGELSGGEQQRVGIARAIVRKPTIILADEPTGNVDPENAWQLMELFTQINRTGTTVIIATHASDVVDRLRKRVIALEKGRLVRDEKRGVYGHES